MASNPHRWRILAVVATAFFMTILDVSIVNVPVGIIVLLLTPRIVPESRRDEEGRSYDALGAVLVSAGLALLVYAISEAPNVGWGTARTILLLLLSGALLLGFLVNERRHHDP